MMETQEALKDFTMVMGNVLNDHQEKKGDSWHDCDLQFLIDKLDEEVNEFKEANRPMAKAEELVDVANICMMLYERYVEIWAEKAGKFLSKEG
jgi:hypothetical protein